MKVLISLLLVFNSAYANDPPARTTKTPQKSTSKKLSNKDLMLDSKPRFQPSSEVQNIPKDIQPNELPQPTYTCTLATGATYSMSGPNETDACKGQGGSVNATTDREQKKAPKFNR